ncbi:MAG: hypothetical protein ABI921_00215 [Panacibacter sp.]
MELLIHFDEQKFSNAKNAYNNMLPFLQNAVDGFNEMALSPLSDTDFKKLFTNAEELVFEKMTGGQDVSIAGLKVDKIKAMEIIKKPDGYDVFMNILNGILHDLKHPVSSFIQGIQPVNIGEIYQLNNDGQVIVKETFIQVLEKRCKTFVTTDKAIKVFALCTTIIDKCNELDLMEMIQRNPNGFNGFIREVLQGGDGKPVEINKKGIVNNYN